MTTYELSSIIVAVAALALSILVPLFQFLFAKLQRPKLAIIPFDGYPTTLYFDKSGSSIDIKISLSCLKKDCVVRTIRTCAKSDQGTTACFNWGVLKPINLNWANAGTQQIQLASAELVHPLLLKKDSLTPLNVHFEREGHPSNTALSTEASPSNLNDDIDAPRISASVPPTEVADGFLWRNGSYSITVSVIYDAGEEISASFRFSVSAEEENRLKENDLVIPSADPFIRASSYYSAMVKLENP